MRSRLEVGISIGYSRFLQKQLKIVRLFREQRQSYRVSNRPYGPTETSGRTFCRRRRTYGQWGHRLLAFPKAYPFTTQLIVSTAKTSGADVLVQRYVEGKSWSEINWRRVFAFAAFGFVFLGLVQWAIYVPGYRMYFKEMDRFCNQSIRQKLRNPKGIKELGQQIFIGQFVMQPLTYLPLFYIFRESVTGEKNLLDGTGSYTEIARTALGKYAANFWTDNITMLAFWLPADVVVYSVPIWARMPLNHSISFLWTCVLSWLRGQQPSSDRQKTWTRRPS